MSSSEFQSEFENVIFFNVSCVVFAIKWYKNKFVLNFKKYKKYTP